MSHTRQGPMSGLLEKGQNWQAPQAVAVIEPQEVVAKQGEPLFDLIAMALRDRDVDVPKMRELLQMQREIMADQAKGEFNREFALAYAKMPVVPKDGIVADKNGKKIYNFARYEDMDAFVRPIETEHGFARTFSESNIQGQGRTIVGVLLHRTGHSMTATITLPPNTGPLRNDLQAAGGTITFARRYLTEMLWNMVRVGTDKDGTDWRAPLSGDQVAELERLIAETHTDLGQFLATMVSGAASLVEVPHADFPRLVNALNVKKQRMQERGDG